ncbi:NADP-dependent oxidoreductase [Chryseobacterium indoltheticum]|uniref:NADPH:quinone reductase n=1 Tax=Chryseobacterium indoltheticum TaxID=254 RepID=A0A381FHC7_9FLAO|nr:NADP-dependent oxidoreductase [Chryseobacterium indoltheticum]AZA74713.1 NADP-dependent oxidoreductase [Chryseobacterium indoltheticum]SIQ37799.1 NADPH:quinone reductase [Chryseobacterium indoltheticum]SUX45873.1 Zinc-type alcohol dehydrogenase-like protein SA1988 [Chryseobacterium indoltheticum]
MKAFSISRYKKESPLELVDLPEPIVKDHEVLVEIHAASVNLLDSKIKSGEFKLILPYKMPLVLGHDVAGIIVKTGAKVKNFKVGDEIYSRPSDFHIGTFAEFISIDEKDVALKPKNLSMEEAASIPLVGLTAWQALIEQSNVQKGQKVFIQAGSGGVGTFAIQLAKYMGATVATTASEKSFDVLKNLGADVLIDYKTQDFEDALIDYDVVLNSQDNKTLEKSFEVIKPGGKIVSISGPPTPVFAEEHRLPWYVKLATRFLSSKIRKRAKKQNVNYSFLFMTANGKQLSEITHLIESGKIKPVIDKVFAFEKTNDALQYIESGRAKGKVVIKMK